MKNQNSQRRALQLANQFVSTTEGRALVAEMHKAEKDVKTTIENQHLIEVAFLEYIHKINKFYLHQNEYLYQIAYQDGLQDCIELTEVTVLREKYNNLVKQLRECIIPRDEKEDDYNWSKLTKIAKEVQEDN